MFWTCRPGRLRLTGRKPLDSISAAQHSQHRLSFACLRNICMFCMYIGCMRYVKRVCA
jgi:hypothetical protein